MFQSNGYKDGLLLHREGHRASTSEQLAIPGVDVEAQDDGLAEGGGEVRERRFSRIVRGVGNIATKFGAWNDGRKSSAELVGTAMDKTTEGLNKVGDVASTVYDSTPAVVGQVAGAYYRDAKEMAGNTVSATVAGSKVIALAGKKVGKRMWRRIKSDVSAGAELAGAAASTTAEMIGNKVDGVVENVESRVGDARDSLRNIGEQAKARREQRRKNKYNAMIDRRRVYLNGVESQLGVKIRNLQEQRRATVAELNGLPSTPDNPL